MFFRDLITSLLIGYLSRVQFGDLSAITAESVEERCYGLCMLGTRAGYQP